MSSLIRAVFLSAGLFVLVPLLLLGGRAQGVQAQELPEEVANTIVLQKVCPPEFAGQSFDFVLEVEIGGVNDAGLAQQFGPESVDAVRNIAIQLTLECDGATQEIPLNQIVAQTQTTSHTLLDVLGGIAGLITLGADASVTGIVVEDHDGQFQVSFLGDCAPDGEMDLLLLLEEERGLVCLIINEPLPPALPPVNGNGDGTGISGLTNINVLVAKIQNQVTTDIDASATAVNQNDIDNTSESTSNAENVNVSANTNTSTNTLANSNQSNQNQDNQQAQNQVNDNDQRTDVDASPSVHTGGASGTGGSAGAQSGPAAATGTGTGTATQTGAGTQAGSLGTAPKISPPSTGSAGLAAEGDSAAVHFGGLILLVALGFGIVRLTGAGRSD